MKYEAMRFTMSKMPLAAKRKAYNALTSDYEMIAVEAGRTEDAISLLRSGRGNELMDRIGQTVDTMVAEEERLYQKRDEAQSAATIAFQFAPQAGQPPAPRAASLPAPQAAQARARAARAPLGALPQAAQGRAAQARA